MGLPSIDVAFTSKYEQEVHIDYQQGSAKLMNYCRIKQVKGAKDTTFQIMGTGRATQKSRNGDLVMMNIDHSNVRVALEDYYAPELIDDLDELKIMHNERQAVAMNASAALGRKTDELIINATKSLTETEDITVGGTRLNKNKVHGMIEQIHERELPDDGGIVCVVGPKQWTDLMNIEEFVNSRYVGDDLPYRTSANMRDWNGIKWLVHNGLKKDGNTRKILVWHKTAMGLAIGCDVKTTIDRVPMKDAVLLNSKMSMGAINIDRKGLIIIGCDEN